VRSLAGRSEDRIPVNARFSAHVQTSPGTHPGSYTKANGVFPGVSWQGSDVDHLPYLALRLKKEQNCTSTLALGFRVLFWGERYLYLYLYSFRHLKSINNKI